MSLDNDRRENQTAQDEPSRPPCLPKRKGVPVQSVTGTVEKGLELKRRGKSWASAPPSSCSRRSQAASRFASRGLLLVIYGSPPRQLLLFSRLECQRRTWFVHNAGLTVFHHHDASLWGRDCSSLYADIEALGRVVMKNFSNRDTIIHPHMKIVDGTFLDLLENLIVHRTSSFLKVLLGCTLSFHHVEDIVSDVSPEKQEMCQVEGRHLL